MGPAETFPALPEMLTWAEICQRYPDQRLCLVEVEYIHPNGLAIRTARVVGHGDTLDKALEQAHAWREHYKVMTFNSTRNVRDKLPRAPRIVHERHEHP